MSISGDLVNLMATMCARGGVEVGEPGSELCRLQALGFIEISQANGVRALARVTREGLCAVLMRRAQATALHYTTRLRGHAANVAPAKHLDEGDEA